MADLRSNRPRSSANSADGVSGIYDALSDVELTTAMAHGRKEALAEIYDRYGSSVYALARRLCAGEAAKDVTHEVFLALWQTPESFDPDRGSLEFAPPGRRPPRCRFSRTKWRGRAP